MRRPRRLLIRLIYLAIVAAGAYWLWHSIPAEMKRVIYETYVAPGQQAKP